MGDKAASQDEKSDEEETMGDNASEDEKSDEEKSVQLEDMLEQDDDDDDDNQESNPRPKKTKPWFKDMNVYRILIMLFLTMCLFVAELTIGLITNSLALVSDAFHMASDCLAFGIGLVALQMAKKNARPGSRYTYGLGRAEVIGGLVNGVFLFTISLFIVYEALSRFIDVPTISDPLMIVYVASAGLAVNVFGIFLFLGHSGIGHGHSHGGGGHGHSHGKKKKKGQAESESESEEKEGHQHSKRKNMNLHGVFLHILGDALASIAAITSGLLIEFVPWSGRYYFDPILSVLISLIIMKSAIPLIWSSTQILMQSGPKGVDISGLSADIERIPNVLRVHDLHVWQLLGDKPIASIHILCKKPSKFMKTARQIKAVFHELDIHTVTIQPEFLASKDEAEIEKQCLLHCAEDCESTDPLV